MESAAVAHLAELLVERKVSRGVFLFEEGEPPDEVFIVRSGLVKVTKFGPDGRGIAIRLVPPGALVGEVAVLDGRPYPASAEALEDSAVLMLSRDKLLSFLQRHPDAGLAVMAVLAGRLRTAYAELRALAADTIEQRVGSLLLRLAETVPQAERDAQFSIPLSRQDVADLVGGAKENVSRIMGRLARLGIISAGRGRIVVAAPARLRDFCAKIQVDRSV